MDKNTERFYEERQNEIKEKSMFFDWSGFTNAEYRKLIREAIEGVQSEPISLPCKYEAHKEFKLEISSKEQNSIDFDIYNGASETQESLWGFHVEQFKSFPSYEDMRHQVEFAFEVEFDNGVSLSHNADKHKIEADVIHDKYRGKFVLVTETESNSIVPHFYVENYEPRTGYGTHADHKAIESMTQEFLTALKNSKEEYVTDEVKEYAEKTLEWGKKIFHAIAESQGEIDIEVEGNKGNVHAIVEPMLFSRNYDYIKPNIEYYSAESTNDIIRSSSNLYEVAESFTHAKELQKAYERSVDDLQDFYEKNIYPYRNLSFDERTEEQQSNFGYFSDWHKDVYGHRPHGDRNECLKIHEAREREASEISHEPYISLAYTSDAYEQPFTLVNVSNSGVTEYYDSNGDRPLFDSLAEVSAYIAKNHLDVQVDDSFIQEDIERRANELATHYGDVLSAYDSSLEINDKANELSKAIIAQDKTKLLEIYSEITQILEEKGNDEAFKEVATQLADINYKVTNAMYGNFKDESIVYGFSHSFSLEEPYFENDSNGVFIEFQSDISFDDYDRFAVRTDLFAKTGYSSYAEMLDDVEDEYINVYVKLYENGDVSAVLLYDYEEYDVALSEKDKEFIKNVAERDYDMEELMAEAKEEVDEPNKLIEAIKEHGSEIGGEDFNRRMDFQNEVANFYNSLANEDMDIGLKAEKVRNFLLVQQNEFIVEYFNGNRDIVEAALLQHTDADKALINELSKQSDEIVAYLLYQKEQRAKEGATVNANNSKGNKVTDEKPAESKNTKSTQKPVDRE